MNLNSKILFSRVIPTTEHINILFKLLNSRANSISHQSKTSIDEHKGFVKSHPYRIWYIVLDEKKAIGSFYVSNDNTIGINLNDSINNAMVAMIINHVKENFSPLPEIKSVRAKNFSINVHPDNILLRRALDILEVEIIQLTYSISKID